MEKICKIFISHSWTNLDELRNMENLLKHKGCSSVVFEELVFEDRFDSVNADKIKQLLEDKIRKSNVFVGIAGESIANQEWLQWELETAVAHNVPIVGVLPRGQNVVSEVFNENASQVVKWYTESIVSAIKLCAKK